MSLAKTDLIELCRRRARRYELTAALQYLDLKLAGWAPRRLQRLAILITLPFGADREVAERRCWETLRAHLSSTRIEQLYGGFSYLAVGQAGGAN